MSCFQNKALGLRRKAAFVTELKPEHFHMGPWPGTQDLWIKVAHRGRQKSLS